MAAGIITNLVLDFTSSLLWPHHKLLLVILDFLQPISIGLGAFLFWRGRQYAAQASAVSIITDAKPQAEPQLNSQNFCSFLNWSLRTPTTGTAKEIGCNAESM